MLFNLLTSTAVNPMRIWDDTRRRRPPGAMAYTPEVSRMRISQAYGEKHLAQKPSGAGVP